MGTKLSSIMLVVLCTLFTSVAQIFYKFGADKLSFNLLTIITNYHIIIGLAIYGIAAAILIIALRGGELTVLYPIIATSYIWVALMSSFFFNEIINVFKWLGIFTIIIGIIFISFGGKEKFNKVMPA